MKGKRKRKPTWTPATGFQVIKLPPNGPKSNQSVEAWLYGKSKSYQEFIDNPRNKFHDIH